MVGKGTIEEIEETTKYLVTGVIDETEEHGNRNPEQWDYFRCY
ncbi:hypothetical protein CRE_25697 [Caenorhabditis remanei]|uniref:Uncharacterized protein n=1 Tax=Caenorhabditis remanei TaxID=31234 RepID=E3ML56_CAERE|nr:hypothetical protein CRE_25697 [Caenorhabditis remanei]